ncbi:MAG: hypothetical protein NZ853_07130 [Leptospiraceae bacterium]|nr:hypothetical protein [Leptospiraceae bacterium]MDW7975794.1 hypothetical protein [Leptospiraceae bacterium]
MKKKGFKILLIHENFEQLREIKSFLKENKYKVYACTTSQFALLIQNKIHPEIIITSLKAKGLLKNKDLFYTLIDTNYTPIMILLVENEEEFRLTLELPKEKIFEILYLSNNIKEIMITTLEAAKRYIKEKNNLYKYLKEFEFQWAKQIEWYIWKEYHRTIYQTNFSKKLIENIRNSMLQGLGIGSLISYMELIEIKKKEVHNEEIAIPKHLYSKLKENVNKLEIWFKKLENIIHYFNKTFPIEKISCDQFQEILLQSIHELESFRKIKNQKFCIGNLYYQGEITSNHQALLVIFKEIFINALKYSPENSFIDIILIDNKENILFGVVNDILEFMGGISGIPEEYETQVFEPMMRLNHFYDERFLEEEFTLGIGLTIVKLYLKYFDGHIYLKEIIDHNRDSKKRILCGVTLVK